MRLLFDEQLSEELVKMLDDLFPDSLHIRLLGAGGAADLSVWQAAREHQVVWLRIGNCATEDIARLLRNRAEDIRRFETQSEETFLELG